jgi:outer membrane protein assembly factor BamB
MKIFKNKIAAFAVVMLFLLSMMASAMLMPNTNAHSPAWQVPSWTLLSAGPSPIGVGQIIRVDMWARPSPPTGADNDVYSFMVVVIKPDGTNETVGPFKSDVGGDAATNYIPIEEGTYTFVAQFQGITLTGLPASSANPASVGDVILPSNSNPVNVTVQSDPIPSWQMPPLPTAYWTVPINQNNRNWYTIASNWLGFDSAAQTSHWEIDNNALDLPRLTSTSQVPGSAHIMWTRPLWAGGIMDQRTGSNGYASVLYEGLKLYPPIILNGRLIYSNYDTGGSIAGWYVVDLYTGETINFYNTTRTATITGAGPYLEQPDFAQIYEYDSANQHGGFPYVWITRGVNLPSGYTSRSGTQTWEMLDGYTYSTVAIIANVSASGFPAYGNDGSILRYTLVTQNKVQYLQCWNTSQIETMGITPNVAQGNQLYGNYYPEQNFVKNGDTGWSINVSLSSPVTGTILAVEPGQYVVGGVGGIHNSTTIIKGNLWALSVKTEDAGRLLWNISFTPPETVMPDIVATELGGVPSDQFGTYLSNNGLVKHRYQVGLDGIDLADGIFTFAEGLTLKRWGYSLETGEMLWGPTEPESAFNYFDSMPNVFYEGMLISWGYSGIVTAYNVTTGKILWTYTDKPGGSDTSFYGNNPMNLEFTADGKLVFDSSDHSPNSPLEQGYYLVCVNASNGAELWRLLNWGTAREAIGESGIWTASVADGYITAFNAYDAQIYCIGKGPSALTVSAPDVGVTTSTPITISGTITDISAGSKQHAVAANFPRGLPCVSDASMSHFMEAVYEQQQMPTNVTGVPVTLSVLDSNGNYRDIGTTTSSIYGTYSLIWTPDIPGNYTVIANFAGSQSYYASSASTAFYASETAATVSPAPTALASVADQYILPGIIGIIITIVIVGIFLALLLLRRRP